ncbi:hypothetical protein N7461_004909 [Penicillium sp. DV-2018c]|nr:hypothetical protein N7461_004909 [Penicillium sp. DV-2018c]
MLFKKRESHDAPPSSMGEPHSNNRAQLPMLNLPDMMRYNLLCVMGEFVGTFLFLFFSFAGTQVANTPMPPPGSPPNVTALQYSALSFGFALTVNVWAFFRVTGGLFNPAVTLALCLSGGMPVIRGLFVFPAQLVGGIAAAGVVSALFPGPLNCSTRLGGGTSISQGLFIEMFLTAQLVIVIIMLAVVKHKSTYLAPVGIGLTFFVAELIGYHWIYWVGPFLGSLLASGYYRLLCFVRWERINPGQDYNEWEVQKVATAGSEGSTIADQVHRGQSMTMSRDPTRETTREMAPEQQV